MFLPDTRAQEKAKGRIWLEFKIFSFCLWLTFMELLCLNLLNSAGVEPWTFVQELGEAIFIPAGCPHQVRNLKVYSLLYL